MKKNVVKKFVKTGVIMTTVAVNMFALNTVAFADAPSNKSNNYKKR